MESKLVHLCNTPSTPWDLHMWSSVYNIKLFAWLISIHLYQPAIMADKYFKIQPLKTTNTWSWLRSLGQLMVQLLWAGLDWSQLARICVSVLAQQVSRGLAGLGWPHSHVWQLAGCSLKGQGWLGQVSLNIQEPSSAYSYSDVGIFRGWTMNPLKA